MGCLENTDLEKADLENADLENAYLENAYLKNTYLENTDLENVVCVLDWEASLFNKINDGKKDVSRAQHYHQKRFKFINKLSLPEMSKMADAWQISDCLLCSYRLHKIENR